MRRPSSNATLLAVVLAAASGLAMAKSSDRNAPMNIEANTTTYNANNDSTPTVLSGNVVITQGTLRINASQGTMVQAGGRPSRARLTGGVTMSQTLDDGTPVNTRSAAVDYDFSTEIIILTGNVTITQPRGNLSGERVVYNMRTGQVQSGGQGGGRVRMTIQPKAGG